MEVSSVSPSSVASTPNAQGESQTQTLLKIDSEKQLQSGATPPAEDADSARGSLLTTVS